LISNRPCNDQSKEKHNTAYESGNNLWKDRDSFVRIRYSSHDENYTLWKSIKVNAE